MNAEKAGITTEELCAVELATGLCFSDKKLPAGLVSAVHGLRAAGPFATIGDMARAYLDQRGHALARAQKVQS